MTNLEPNTLPMVSGEVIVMSKVKAGFFLVCGLLIFVPFAAVSVTPIILSVDDANPFIALWSVLLIPPALLFGWFVYIVTRSLYLGERLVVGNDRIQVVWGESQVIGELLFANVAEVKLVEIDTNSWHENTVGFRLKDPSQVPLYWPDTTCSQTRKLERWSIRKRYNCDMTIGLGWQNSADAHDIIVRRWQAFRSKAKDQSS